MSDERDTEIEVPALTAFFEAIAAGKLHASVNFSLFPSDREEVSLAPRDVSIGTRSPLATGEFEGLMGKISEILSTTKAVSRIVRDRAFTRGSPENAGREKQEPESPVQTDRHGMFRVLDLTAGTIVSDEQMAAADYVIVGGEIVKNRDGPVMGYAKAATDSEERFAEIKSYEPSEIDYVRANMRHVHYMLNLLGSPHSPAERAVTEFGTRTLGQIRKGLCDELQVIDSALESRLAVLDHEAGEAAAVEARGEDLMSEIRGSRIYIYADPDPAPSALRRYTLGATFDAADLVRDGRVFVGEFPPREMKDGEPLREKAEAFDALEAATAHLVQGLASGMLQGDELRSVLENSPTLTRQLCRGFRVLPDFGRVGEIIRPLHLREWAEDGRLTSKNVIRAMVAVLTKSSMDA